MSSDIQPGDVVIVVPNDCGSGGHSGRAIGLRNGAIHRVSDVIPRDAWWPTQCPCGIKLVGFSYAEDEAGTCGARFRKIRPADPEFVALLKRERVPA